jgi:DinB superfamily
MALGTQILDSVLRKSFDNVRWLLEDVDEEDCFWEPVEPCWSVRRCEQAGKGWGRGDWVCEDTWPPPNPLPVTTIAWRIAHIAAWTDVYRNWTFPRFLRLFTRSSVAVVRPWGSVTGGGSVSSL